MATACGYLQSLYSLTNLPNFFCFVVKKQASQKDSLFCLKFAMHILFPKPRHFTLNFKHQLQLVLLCSRHQISYLVFYNSCILRPRKGLWHGLDKELGNPWDYRNWFGLVYFVHERSSPTGFLQWHALISRINKNWPSPRISLRSFTLSGLCERPSSLYFKINSQHVCRW